LKIRRAAALCVCPVTLALVALAPATALADNPGNPGHHYGQLSNPGHHYGQLKHRSPTPVVLPSPPPLVLPSTLHPQAVKPQAAGTALSVGSAAKLAGPVVQTPVQAAAPPPGVTIAPAPLPERNLWLTVIVVAAMLAANVAGALILAARGASYLLGWKRPGAISLRSASVLQPATARVS